MSIRVETETIRSGLVQQRTAYQTIRTHFSLTRANINRYLADDNLAGRAFSANKTYFRDGHIPAALGFERVLDAAIEANDLHISAVDTHLRPHGLYDGATIDANLDWVRGSLFWINVAIIASPLVPWAAGLISLRNERLDFQRDWQNRRDRLNAYIDATGTTHDAVTPFLTALERRMLRIELANPCPTTGAMLLPTLTDTVLAELRNENGEICWDVLEELFGRGLDGLSEYELDALAKLYMLTDDPEELARFINAMGVKIGLGQEMSGFAEQQLISDEEIMAFFERNTIWHFDSALADAIHDRVELRIADLLLQEYDGNVAAGRNRLRLLQHSALMSVVSTLTPIHFEDTNRDQVFVRERQGANRSNPQVRDVLFGTAESPGIIITRGADRSLEMGFAQLHKRLNMDDMNFGMYTQAMHGNSADQMYLSNYAKRTITISAAYGPGSGSPDFFDEIVNRGEALALSNHEFNLGASILNEAVNIAIGEIPKVGTAIGAVIGVLSDYSDAQDVQRTIIEMADAAKLARRVENEQLNGVFISEGGAYAPLQLWYSPDIKDIRRRTEYPVGLPEVDG